MVNLDRGHMCGYLLIHIMKLLVVFGNVNVCFQILLYGRILYQHLLETTISVLLGAGIDLAVFY